MKEKMEWFSGFIEPYVAAILYNRENTIRVESISRTLMEDLKYMLQTCGVNTIIHKDCSYDLENPDTSKKEFEWIITLTQIRYLKEVYPSLHFSTFKWDLDPLKKEEKESLHLKPNVRILSVSQSSLVDDSYCFTEPKAHAGIFNGIRTFSSLAE